MTQSLVLSRHQSQAFDRLAIEEYGVPGIVLMENAGRNIFDKFLTYKPQGKIIICCGQGNNGGDGFVVARYLNLHGFDVHVLLFCDPDKIKGDAKINYGILVKLAIPITVISKEHIEEALPILSDAHWIVDALFGTGLQGLVKKPFDKIINLINSANKKVLSIDIPSGLDCDSGEVLGVAIKANITVTMVRIKKGFDQAQAKKYLGEIHAVDLGIPSSIATPLY
ncbi:MAG: NAD(P)H-hydrate epimerase [Legionellaceae bacterium]|nr:NAD(P)H-hydrate epimerase [Legionellaceae bacterium]